ncbi:PD-(D/E)XK nuclease family protein [Dasania marina]|uniref:PD-(D/E)XK nuclease family protein n=1 Tax=Dasania marina TaxID=471499 RepID=UPI000378DE01|nr:PD-(D/E)XK nuclease family protein [Dasania marina]
MKLVLAPAFDHGIGLAPLQGVGIRYIGPNGFISLLEGELGLPMPELSHTKNVMAYLQFLQRPEHSAHFYWQSLQNASAIRTAETLLQWRNTLYEYGWNGCWQQAEPKRIADLASVEESGAHKLDIGLGQRSLRVISRLDVFITQIETIEIIDADALTPCIQAIVTKLAGQGVAIQHLSDFALRAQGDLALLQTAFTHPAQQQISLSNDGSVQWLQAQSLQTAVRWLAETVRLHPNKQIAIFAPNDAEAIDDALMAAGLPLTAHSVSSSARPVLQLLPLTLQLLQAPLNPGALLQFLTHPVNPLPYRLCRMLADVVANNPGIDSEPWRQVVQSYFELLEQGDATAVKAQRKQLADWLDVARYPQNAVSVTAINQQLQLLHRWLRGREANLENPKERLLYQQAMAQVDEFAQALDVLATNTQQLTTNDIDDVMRQVRSRGSAMSGREAQAGHITVLTDAGSFAPELDSGIYDIVIWLGVEEQTIKTWPWFKQEQKALRQQGIDLPEQASLAELANQQLNRLLLAASEQLLLVQLQRNNAAHPVLEKIRSCLGEGFSAQPLQQLMLQPQPAMKQIASIQLPQRQRWWQFDKGLLSEPSVRWSYSRVQKYLFTPHEYVFNYMAKIRNDDVLSLNDDARLKGSLIHWLVEAFFEQHGDNSWRALDEQALAAWARKELSQLINQRGAVLIQPGRHVEAEQLKATGVSALQCLVGHLKSSDVATIEVEKKQEATFGADTFLGYIDLLVIHNDGTETVIDIKLGGLSKRRDEIKHNLALQLTTYSWLRRENGATTWPEHGYFIINGNQLLMANKHKFPEATVVQTVDPGSSAELWGKMQMTLAWRKAQLLAGEVELPLKDIPQDRAVEPAASGLAMGDQDEQWSDYSHLTGWE